MNPETNSANKNALLKPIYIIGAGGIVNDAHLPAYKLADFRVAGIYDRDQDKMRSTSKKYSIPDAFNSLEDLLENIQPHAVFDLAVPPASVIPILQRLPGESVVLIQKPMGSNIGEAKQILDICRNQNFIAAVNFQLRYAPAIIKTRELIRSGVLGEICDIEVNVNVYTPWDLWTFLYEAKRVEILYHSIHYVDLVRSFLGNPSGIQAKTVKHPLSPRLASVRSNIIMDYGDMVRANILTNHSHDFGTLHQQSYIKFEGTMGAIRISLGVLQNYPAGHEDQFEYIVLDHNRKGEWRTLPLEGTWFPHAFIGSMNELMEAAHSAKQPDHSVEDCIYTMACVEAAYHSGNEGGKSPGDFLK